MTLLKQRFNLCAVKTKGLTLLIEHGPCCILSFAAGLAGLPGLRHNPALELGFAFIGALGGEYIGHRFFHKADSKHAIKPESARKALRRYGVSLLFGLASWGVHQKVFHKHHETEMTAEMPEMKTPAGAFIPR